MDINSRPRNDRGNPMVGEIIVIGISATDMLTARAATSPLLPSILLIRDNLPRKIRIS